MKKNKFLNKKKESKLIHTWRCTTTECPELRTLRMFGIRNRKIDRLHLICEKCVTTLRSGHTTPRERTHKYKENNFELKFEWRKKSGANQISFFFSHFDLCLCSWSIFPPSAVCVDIRHTSPHRYEIDQTLYVCTNGRLRSRLPVCELCVAKSK